ncbi:signal recognition particle protein [Desulfurispirillum indicum S5]|uniref:Signal recognition particle protein n=1 Tax=Desulfurispirillum indicum (strain ATCC BAA-1389 / DSM 22839 / S5) TaxID=653733 RepID=E6W6E2_DESIS|nr:signal recognition particle protein [Desulfurispirillum indicum]ADU67277.1 signal recognition particle protein [Desulfurispirillum indicum S5]
MFSQLQNSFQKVFKDLRGQGKISEANIQEALREVRVALLDADVNIKVVRQFIAQVKEKALGQEVLQSLTPGQQFIKIVDAELTELMGQTHTKLHLSSTPPTVVMMCGLQGSGKTTTAGKLAASFKKQGRKVMLAGADIYRPAAVEQIRALAEQVGVDVYAPGTDISPVEICAQARKLAMGKQIDLLILDTAGRLHIDDALMEELVQIKASARPDEILFVADAMTGQEAVNVAQSFDERLDLSGVILTKMDSDARGGAALSIRALLGKPIKYIGGGEKMDALEPFHPDRVASRILGMGDMLTLIEKAESVYDEKTAKNLERKIRGNEFSMQDFKDQLLQIKKMGSLGSIMKMIPGMSSKMGDMDIDDSQYKPVVAIIDSMTPQEREKPEIINANRRRRIAKGSGRTVQEVNRLLKQFQDMRKMMKQFSGAGGKNKKQQQAMMRQLQARMPKGAMGGKMPFGRR